MQLMEDITLEEKTKSKTYTSTTAKNDKEKDVKPAGPSLSGKLKVEMQTIRISEESEQQLYNSLKHIYGADFKLSDASEFKNKKSNLGKQYWMERGNLVVKRIVNYSSKDTTPKNQEQITRQFAMIKLERYGFHPLHCTEALIHTKDYLGKALEVLFYKYYRIEDIQKNRNLESFDAIEALERQSEEKEALESIYGDAFLEEIKNRIWIVQLKLNYLTNNREIEQVVVKKEKQEKVKEVCRLFVHKKCRFGDKCKFLHQSPQQKVLPNTSIQEDSCFTLEIRFPEECKYPYEAPYFYIYKNDGMFPRLKCLRIAKRLYDEALLLSSDGTPSIFSIISLLENGYEMGAYLEESKEQFLDQYESLFPKEQDEEEENVASHYELGSTNKRNRKDISWEETTKEDDLIEKRFKEKQKNTNYIRMKEMRRRLPAWSCMNEILETLHQNQVVIISGETGCGKSTQVPQFILDNWIVNRSQSEEKSHINIICTQPRRISAIGVAERVAAERDENVGNTIGYQIRLENKLSSKTRLTFCTTGILLQRLSACPKLSDVTHVIVDEVHERSSESDFLLMLLKELLPKRPSLKVILMSATLKADVFSSYFGKTPILNIPGKTYPVEQVFLEDALERTGYVLEENSKYTQRRINVMETVDLEGLSISIPKESIKDENLTLVQLVNRYHCYSKQTCKNLYVMDHEKINFELVEKILEWIVFGEHDYPRTGSILVFLPGFAEILTLKNQLFSNEILSPRTKHFVIVPLHSSLSSEEQSLVFQKTRNGVRKIVLSTNLAETSITIDDCVFVIDTGKMKETRFNSNQNMESLETCWVSRANAMQRKGRAGRVMPGVCIHLYTSYRYKHQFAAQPIPEILRIALEPLLLRIQLISRGKKVDLHKILGRMLEPPTSNSITNAIKRLQDVGAFDSEHMLTPLGHHLAALPVNVRIGKLIIFGAIFCCLDSALTIAACLSHKSPFSIPFDKRHEIDPKKEFFSVNSDQLTILKVYKKWLIARSRSSNAGQAFVNENYLSERTLHALADIKYQLLELLVSIGFVPVDLPPRQPSVDNVLKITGFELNVNGENYKLLQGLLCAALYPNVVKVFTPCKSFQMQSVGAIPMQPKPEELRFQTRHDGFVNIHPSSVNFQIGHFMSPYLVYQEKVKTSRVFIKEVSMVPILSLILFSGYQLNMELHDDMFMLSLGDGWIMFGVESHRVGQLLQRIRIELAKLLEQKMQDPLLNLLNHQQGKQIIHTIVNVITRE